MPLKRKSAASQSDKSAGPRWPNGKLFALAIIDDTDVATIENIKPTYRMLERLGIQATKTVWPVACPEGSRHFSKSQTLDDPDYLDFVQDLQRRGFEIAFHGATMESSTRERTVRALERFRESFASYPRVHASHSLNRENIYWGTDRIDQPLIKWLYGRALGVSADHYVGHVQGSAHWWGDLCQSKIEYVRNLTFNSLNLSTINPSMPYTDPKRPLVQRWYSASDAEDAEEFKRLLNSASQDQLERSGGFSIVATHFGKQFVKDGQVDPGVRDRLEELSGRAGWFCSVGHLLDWLRAQRDSDELPQNEWSRMQLLWLRALLARKLAAKWDKARPWRLPASSSRPDPQQNEGAAP